MPGGFDIDPVEAQIGQGAQQNSLLNNPIQTMQGINALRLFPLQQQALGLQVQTGQQDLRNKQAANLRSVLYSVKAKPGATAADYLSAVSQGAAAGLFPEDMANSYAGGDTAGLDLPHWQTLAQEGAVASGDTAGLEAQFGNTETRNLGGKVSTVNINRVTGQANTLGGDAATQSQTLTPSEEASAVPVVGPGGVTTRGTLSQYVTPTGQPQPGVAPPVIANPLESSKGAAVGAATTTMFNYTGKDGAQHQITGGALLNRDGTMKPNVQDATGNPITDAKGVLQVSLPPEQVALLNSTATNEADRASSLQTAFEGSTARKSLAQEMLQANGEFRSGPGAAHWGNIVTEANRVLGTKFAADPTTAQQVAGKIAQMLSAQQRDTLGLPATNAGQEAANVASPNTAYSAGAIQTLAGQLAGNEDLIQKKQAAWTAYHKAGGSYNGFVSQFNKINDPRYYWDQYVPDQQKATTGMTPAAAAAYNAAERRAMSLKY